ncbi:serum response factor-like [Octopus vulgaris]|uniref:Serum response factor-like n=1 Tax=Octopus vulgaris TaxID=6645 RepID=A0AA36B7V9_OCTVU|nr:serum response factor-like [Octopus vulgaris]
MQNSNHCETLTVSQYVHSDNITNGSRLLVDQSVFKTSGIASTAPSGADSKHLSLAPGSRMQTTMVSTHSNNELGDDNSDSDSESDCIGNDLHLQSQSHQQNQSQHQVRRPPDGLKPGKKTKGRVKIKMEFIQNKLRRYTTFSKRKTGIMKKAYELSTLTGTQVMLLVASETGHVYTFATRKLQPMITSDSGKALIQTCLNSPDTSADGPSHQQRMNPTGFEETELTYSVEDENKADLKPLLAQMPGDQVLNRSQLIEPSDLQRSDVSKFEDLFVSKVSTKEGIDYFLQYSGGAALVKMGKKKGCLKLMKDENPEKLFVHCYHRENLVFKNMSPVLNEPLDVSIIGPLKKALRAEWENWFSNGKKAYTNKGYRKKPSYQEIANLVTQAVATLNFKKNTIKRAFERYGIAARGQTVAHKTLQITLRGCFVWL